MDDRKGSVGQARGIIAALDDTYDIEEKNIVYTRLARLPNIFKGASLVGLNKKASDDFNAPFPDLILSISRRTAPIARWIKKKSKGKSKIIQLMHPGKCGLKDFDLLIIPEHDRHKKVGNRAVYITGCPHRTTAKALNEAEARWAPVFADLPRPLTTLIIGGAIKDRPFSEENAKRLAQEVLQFKNDVGGALLITSSRRTGAAAEKILKNALKDIPSYTFWWGENKENPYMGFLACADQIIVTGDTVSMCSEACGTGKPVLIFRGENWLFPKHHRFVDSLLAGNYACALEAADAKEFQPKQRLDAAGFIAEKIKTI